jgi:hypothetical protein
MNEMTNEQKDKAYRLQVPYNMGHYYIGFEGQRCSRMDTDDKKRVIAECAWVWDTRKKKWLKRPVGGAQ